MGAAEKTGATDVTRIGRLGLVILIVVSCTACDQAVKSIAKESLAASPPLSLLNDFIRIEYSENPGAILGLGAGLPSPIRLLFFIIFVSVILTLTLVFTLNPRGYSLMQIAGLALVAAGGMGNLLDRLFNNGVVIDYISFGIGALRTGIFNVADVAIMAGGVIVVLFSARPYQSAVDLPRLL
jgi:signal peptidase II